MSKISTKSRLVWKGNVRITVFNLDGSIKEVKEFKNEIKNDGLNMVRDGLYGTVTDLQIKYCALGSSNAANNPAQSDLVAETFRKAITVRTPGGTGVLTDTTYIAPYEAVAPPNIEEIGWFAGVDATAAANSGIMVARILYSRAKTNLESLQIDRVDTLVEA